MKKYGSHYLLAVIGTLGFSPLAASPDIGEPPATAAVPAGLTSGEWAGIREAHEAWKQRFSGAGDGTYYAINTIQQWSTVFDGCGFLTEPKGQTWKWGLELKGYGMGESRNAVSGQAEIQATDTRLSYHWDKNLEEWFLNDGRGLEQGWTLQTRPGGVGANEKSLQLDLAVRGDLRPLVDAGGQSVHFVDSHKITALTYGGLKAWDAMGQVLPTRFLSRSDGITVEVDERGATYPVTIDPIAQQAYLKANNSEASDEFGFSVAVSGGTVVVGAVSEDSGTTGVNSVPNEGASGAGAVYIFIRSRGVWTQQAYLKASNTGAFDNFGNSVAISGDTVVVGASAEDSATTGVNTTPDEGANAAGAAYIFIRSGGIWAQQAYLKANNTDADDRFGQSVAVSGDTVLVGVPFEDSGTTGVNSNANEVAGESGAVYIFTRSGNVWSEQAYLKANNTDADDRFGQSVAVSGDTVVVGAYEEDSSTIGVNSNPDEGASNSGAAYIFIRSGGIWAQQAYLKANNTDSNDEFGFSVAVSGDTVLVGAIGEDSSATGVNSPTNEGATSAGAAYIFTRSGGIWAQQAYLKSSNTGTFDQFGISVAVSGDTVVVGADREDSTTAGVNTTPNEGAGDSGAAYIFIRSGGIWSGPVYLKASNTGAGDNFGRSVTVSGGTVVVGADLESSSTSGVNSVPDDLASFSGAAYIFIISTPSSAPTLKLSGKAKLTTSKSRFTLKGTAADVDGDLIRVEARDSRVRGTKKFRSAKGTTRWKYKAPLKSGRNKIQIRAVDAKGNRSAVKQVTITKKA